LPSNGKNGQTKHLPADKEAFCRLMAFESSTEFNQSDAFIQTHKCAHLTKKTIWEKASRLMKDGKVVARIEELRKPVLDRFKADHEAWLMRLREMVFLDKRRMFDKHNNCIDIPDMPADVSSSIAGFEISEEFVGKKEGEKRIAVGYTKRFKMVNPLDAIELYGKALGFFPSEKAMALAAKVEVEEVNRSICVTFVHAPPRPSFTPEEPT